MNKTVIPVEQYEWKLCDLDKLEKKNIKVFSCFSGAGGSTMGYKRNGFDTIGALDIDPKQLDLYKLNFKPKYDFCDDIRNFNLNAIDGKLPQDMYELDILDGSPPCTAFSVMASWANRKHLDINNIGNHKRKYYEGVVEQSIDDLYFHFIETVNILKPKSFISENVLGLTTGKGKPYLDKIISDFKDIGYSVRYDILYGAYIGLPQNRNRVFIYGVKKDIMSQDELNALNFDAIYTHTDSTLITFGDIRDDSYDTDATRLSINTDRYPMWLNSQILYAENPNIKLSRPNIIKRFDPNKKVSGYGSQVYKNTDVINTMSTTVCSDFIKLDKPYYMNNVELCKASSFPLDYRFTLDGKTVRSRLGYAIGMAVPPMMTQAVSKFVYDNILNKNKD
jgi:DNA (cytosine-5)-methyltransferase 1